MKQNKIRAGIIDDEAHCIKTLQYQLKKHFADVEVVMETTDSTAATALVHECKPSLIFLDIEMPGLNGLQFLSQFEQIPFKVIFTTAYDRYAIRAIRLNALDYLLKPINTDELKDAIEKFKTENDKTDKEQITHLQLFREKKVEGTLALASSRGLFFVKINEIMYLEGDSCYTHVTMADGKKYLVSKTLLHFDVLLEENATFFRVHKSFIINLNYIRQYIRGDGGEIVMVDNKVISLSRNNKEDFLKLFTKL